MEWSWPSVAAVGVACLSAACSHILPPGPSRVGVGQRGASHSLGCRHSSVAQVSRRTAILIRHGESVWNEAQVRSARRARAQTCLSGH
jgi:hypothetical protein